MYYDMHMHGNQGYIIIMIYDTRCVSRGEMLGPLVYIQNTYFGGSQTQSMIVVYNCTVMIMQCMHGRRSYRAGLH